MAREVAIKVKVNGTDQAVKSIDDLENAISQLKDELKTTEIGSEQFKKLSGEIQGAESKLKTLNKSFEGLEPQQKVEGFVKLGEGIAGAFAIGTAALTAFGVESEEVEKAQVAVQTAIAASIGARQLAEASLQAQVVATTISQKAYNLAASAGNAITKAFYTTLAANPITAIVVAVAALAAGIYALVKSMEEQITAQDEINDSLVEAQKNTIKQELALTSLNKIIQDTTKSDEDRQRALDKLKKELPELNGLELDRKDALDQINTAVERNIKLIQERAKAEALAELISKKTAEILEIQNSELNDNVGFWEASWIRLKNSYNPILAETAVGIQGVQNKLEAQNKAQGDLDQITKQYIDTLDGLFEIEEDINDEREEELKKEERRKKAAAEREKRKKAEIDLLRKELALRGALVEVETGDLGTPEFLTAVEDAIKEYQSAIDQAFGVDVFEEYKESFSFLEDTGKDLFQSFIDPITFSITALREQIRTIFDGDDISEGATQQFQTTLENLDQQLDAGLDDFALRLKEGLVSEEQYGFFTSFFNNYKAFIDELQKTPLILDSDTAKQDIAELDLLITTFLGTTQRVFMDEGMNFASSMGPSPLYGLFAEGIITEEEFDKLRDAMNDEESRIYEIQSLLFDLQEQFDEGELSPKNYFERSRELREELEGLAKQSYQSYQVDELFTPEGFTEATNNLEAFRAKLIETYTQRLTQQEDYIKAYEDETERENAAREEATNRVDNLINLRKQLIVSEQQYLKVKEDIFLQDNASYGLEERAKAAFLFNNKERVFDAIYTNAEILRAETDRVFSQEELDLGYKDFYKFLLDQEVEVYNLSLEERKKLYDNYVEYVKGKNKEAADDGKSKIEEQKYDFDDFVRDFQQTAQLSVQVFTQYLNSQLTLMAEREKRLLDQIVGDSEEAEQKRTEIQEQYEEQRKQLTKQNQLAQLQLTRIQATANVAEAISKAYAEGGFTIGAVFAGIMAALGAVQVGVITSQINQVQNLARGGLLVGNTHEYGGIPLAGGGVVAEGGEAVINRQSSINYRGLLNEVSMSSGGAPMVASSFDDTRLIEAITKQNRDPIKAYVLEQDITRSQSVNKRLQQLSKI